MQKYNRVLGRIIGDRLTQLTQAYEEGTVGGGSVGQVDSNFIRVVEKTNTVRSEFCGNRPTILSYVEAVQHVVF